MPNDSEGSRNGISVLAEDKQLLLELQKHFLLRNNKVKSISAIYRDGLHLLAAHEGVTLDP